jgi:hypothetical protein
MLLAMATDTYRITQSADHTFHVEKLCTFLKPRRWPWSEKVYEDRFVKVLNKVNATHRFTSEAEAQKWIDDKRKYPIVVKEHA